MALTECANGHLYDTDMYATCPYCNGGSNMITNIAGIGLVLNVTKNRSLSGSYQTPQSDTSALRYTTIYHS